MLLFGVCLVLGLAVPPGEVERGSIGAEGRPNIILIVTDALDVTGGGMENLERLGRVIMRLDAALPPEEAE